MIFPVFHKTSLILNINNSQSLCVSLIPFLYGTNVLMEPFLQFAMVVSKILGETVKMQAKKIYFYQYAYSKSFKTLHQLFIKTLLFCTLLVSKKLIPD